MKTLTTKLGGQDIEVRLQEKEYPPQCDYKECRKRGNVYCCYTMDFVNCRAYVPVQIEVMKKWNQL